MIVSKSQGGFWSAAKGEWIGKQAGINHLHAQKNYIQLFAGPKLKQ